MLAIPNVKITAAPEPLPVNECRRNPDVTPMGVKNSPPGLTFNVAIGPTDNAEPYVKIPAAPEPFPVKDCKRRPDVVPIRLLNEPAVVTVSVPIGPVPPPPVIVATVSTTLVF